MSDDGTDDDAKLAEISQQLAAIDVDPARADRIAAVARFDLGRGLPRRRFVEPILVAVVVASFLIWTAIKVWEAFR